MSDLSMTGDAVPEPVSPGDVITAIKRGFSVGTSTLLRPWLLIAGATGLLGLLRPAGQLVQAVGGDLQNDLLMWAGFVVAWALGILITIITLLLAGLQVGLFRAAHQVLIDGPEAVRERGVLVIARERYGLGLAATLLFSVALFIGLLLCFLPGLAVVVLLGMVPFLTVATDTPLFQTFQRSFDLVVRNIAPVLLVYGAAIGVGIVFAGLAVIVSTIVTMIGAMVGAAIGFPLTTITVASWTVQLVVMLIGLPIGYANFILVSALFSTIVARDEGAPLRLTDD
jgi:hypothetical protein